MRKPIHAIRPALGHRAGRERWRVDVEGKWEVPYTAIMTCFINGMPTLTCALMSLSRLYIL